MLWLLLLPPALLLLVYFVERIRRRTRAVQPGHQPDVTLPHTEEWELYHNDFSLCSKKTRACLAELGIAYVSHPVELVETGSYGNLAHGFLKVNPAGLVPVLVHEGHPIYESHEQIAYAAAHASGASQLVPDEPGAREIMDDWVRRTSLIGDDPLRAMHESAGNAVPALTLPLFSTMMEEIPFRRILPGLLFHRLKQRAMFFFVLKQRGPGRLAEMKPILRILDAGKKATCAHLDHLEQALEESGGPYITGAQFTLADVGMMAILDRLREADWEDELLTEARPRVCAYWAELRKRPSYREAIAEFEHPAVVRGTRRIRELKESDENFAAALDGTLA